MNYRHAFHAGNFADLVKHAGLLQLLKALTAQAGPIRVIDTHAGRGLYDLAGREAQASGEAEAGIVHLMTAPDRPSAFAPLTAAVARLNRGGAVRLYPGSPLLIATAKRAVDSYVACELRTEDAAELREVLKGRQNVLVLQGDGYEAARTRTPQRGRALVVIDPPFERADDYSQIVETAAGVRARNPAAALFVWLPLKDLATFDAFLTSFEDAISGSAQVFETRLRPLTDPMKMNGCALVLAGAPDAVAAPIEAACRWTAATLGEAGEARAYGL